MLNTLHTAFITLIVPILTVGLWRTAGLFLSKYFRQRYTVLNELASIGHARSESKRIPGTALICGGSIAGLWTARVCADHFEDVIIVDPEACLANEEGALPVYSKNGEKLDEVPPRSRTRVHQYYAAHVFWNLMLLAMHRLFPGFEKECDERDVRTSDAGILAYSCTGRLLRPPTNWYPNGDIPKMIVCSRDAYERLLRYLVVKSSDRIRRITGTVTGLKVYENDPSRIKTATVVLQSPSEAKIVEIPSTLIIDCTGGTQAGYKWIRKLHAEVTGEEEAVANLWSDVRISYDIHSRWKGFDFYVPPSIRPDLPIPGGYDECKWLISFVPFPGIETKYFVMYRAEGHFIRISFYGWGDPTIPESPQDIKEYLETIHAKQPVPQWVFDLLEKLLKECEEVTTYSGKIPGLSWIHFEDAPYVPSNFIAIGDSVMQVNPIFGQGCTKACIGAIVLDSLLRFASTGTSDIDQGFSSRFFKLHREKTVDAWEGTKPMDYMFSTTTPVKGEKLSDAYTKGRFGILLMELASYDLDIDAVLFHVRQFIAPATDLFAPWVLWRVFRYYVMKKLGKTGA